ARRTGPGDRGVRHSAARRGRHPGRELRRALHHPSRPDRSQGQSPGPVRTGRRAGRGTPIVELPRVVERRPGVMPPRPRPPRRTPRGVLYRRRLAALAVLIAGFAVAWFIVSSFGGGGKHAQTTTAILPVKPFRVVFPEGFTRAQMAQR